MTARAGYGPLLQRDHWARIEDCRVPPSAFGSPPWPGIPRPAESPLDLGFVAIGSSMQSNTWSGLVERIASATGAGVTGFVHEETHRCHDDPQDDTSGPTFIARGD